MRRAILGLAAALAVVVLPQLAAAEGGKHPEGPRHEPRHEFRGGIIVQSGGTLIIEGNGSVTFTGPVIIGAPAPRPSQSVGPLGRHMPQPPMGNMAKPPMFDAKVVFARLDTNKDGKLSFEEFQVGCQKMHQAMVSRMHRWKGPFQGGMPFGHKGMDARKPPFGKPDFAKGPEGPHGDKGVKGPGAPGSKGHKGPRDGHFAKGPKGPEGEHAAKGHEPDGMHQGPGHKHDVVKPEGKKPEPKKPEIKKPEVVRPAKASPAATPAEKATAQNRSFEARLTALERQQAQILSLLRATVRPERQNKELARGGKDTRHEGRPPHADRD